MRKRLVLPLLSFGVLCGCSDGSTGLAGFDVDRRTHDFGAVPLGVSVEAAFEVQNTGEQTLELALALDGDPDFSARPSGATLAPGERLDVQVDLRPRELGERRAALRISDPTGQALAISVELRAEAIGRGFEVMPAQIAFGGVVIGTEEVRALAVTNLSSAPLNLEPSPGEIGPCGGGAPFCVTHEGAPLDGGIEIPAGGGIELEVRFSPRAVGRAQADLRLRICDSSLCEQTVRLEGVGVDTGFSCDPTLVDFGAVSPGRCGQAEIVCENVGNTTVSVSGWTLLLNGADFSAPASAARSLEPREQLTLPLELCPTSLGEKQDVLRIELEAPSGTVDVELRGEGGGPELTVVPEQLVFGLTSVIAPARRALLVTNVGTAPARIVDVEPDTAGTGAFTAPNPPLGTLPAGASAAIDVVFEPPGAGPYASTLRITSEDADQPTLEVRLVGEAISTGPCAAEVVPARLDFGRVEVGDTRRLAVEIRNEDGAIDCLVSSARLLPGGDPDFALVGPGAAFIVPAGRRRTIELSYTPSASVGHEARLELTLSSPTQPRVEVVVSGQGEPPNLTPFVAPSWLDFGVSAPGCRPTARTVRVHNPTTTPVTLTAHTLASGAAGSGFSVTGPSLPAAVPAHSMIELDVTFEANGVGPHADALELALGANAPHVVGLFGRTSTAAVVQESFVQAGTAKVDVLFVVDFTSGMDARQGFLAQAGPALFGLADQYGVDYQVGVTTTDTDDEQGRLMHPMTMRTDPFGGRFADRIVRRGSAPSPAEVFARNVQARFLSGGSGLDEAGFFASYQALSAPVLNGHNTGFLREDARLGVVYVSNEPEQSNPTFGAPARAPDFYFDHLLSLHDFDRRRLVISSIVGDLPSGCTGPGGFGAAAPRYVDLAERTGGVFASVCSTDFATVLHGIAERTFGVTTFFPLAHPAVPSSVEVRVDGVLVPADQWSYDGAREAVVFTPFATPPAGAEVEVRYGVPCQSAP